MKKFDLTVLKIGLEKGLFLSSEVMALLYGDIVCKISPENVHENIWIAKNFADLPIKLRNQIVQLAMQYDVVGDDTIKTVSDEANIRAICTLRTIISEEQFLKNCIKEYYHGVFSAYATPRLAVREIVNWHKWGICFNGEVYQLSKQVFDRFLADVTDCGDVEETIKSKQQRLLHDKQKLKRKAAYLADKTGIFHEEREILNFFTMTTSEKNSYNQLDNLLNQIENTEYLLAQAEVYPLICKETGLLSD
jgi:hypothetical protein